MSNSDNDNINILTLTEFCHFMIDVMHNIVHQRTCFSYDQNIINDSIPAVFSRILTMYHLDLLDTVHAGQRLQAALILPMVPLCLGLAVLLVSCDRVLGVGQVRHSLLNIQLLQVTMK